MKLFSIIILLGYSCLGFCQQRIIQYESCQAFLPDSSELRKNKIRYIESIDYYLGDEKKSNIWDINKKGLVEKIESIDFYVDDMDIEESIRNKFVDSIYTVSYTHLTLPTILRV